MKKIFRISAMLPLALLALGCSSDKDQPEEHLEGDFDIVMTVAPASMGTRATTTDAGSDAENAINNKRLFFGTYNADKTLKHALYEAGTNNALVEANFFLPNWGPSVAAKLPKDDYKNGFYTAAFSIPAGMNSGVNLKHLTDNTFMTLSWPAASGIWEPGGSEDNNVPMAGLGYISKQYINDYYNEVVYGHTPLRLPDVQLTRAMAKIIVEDVDGIMASITLNSMNKGSLLPNIDDLIAKGTNPNTIVRPVTAPGAAKMTQTVAASGVAGAKYVFYAFEESFYNPDGTLKAAGDAARKLITMTPKDSRLGNASIAIAPYAGGSINTGATLKTLDGGVWQGLMRNTVYYFCVKRPSVGGVEIEVKAGEWINYNESFNF